MKQEKLICDIDKCESEKGVKSISMNVIQLDHGDKKLLYSKIDICEGCLNKVLDGQSINLEDSKFFFK